MKRNGFVGFVIATLAVGAAMGVVRAVAAEPVALPAVTEEAAVLPVKVSADDSRVRYMGRFDHGGRGESAIARCSWSGSAVTVRFEGDGLNVRLNESGNGDEYEIVLDGAPAGVLAARSGDHRYAVYPIGAAASGGAHTVTLFKRTEAFVGIGGFEGFEIATGGRVVTPPEMAKRRIEIVGDSISCGYGNEGANQNEHFSPKTENAYLTYGAMAARRLGAEYACIAWSGRKMWPDYTMDEIYGRILPTDPTSVWEFAGRAPDVVLINLGTNDFNAKMPPAEDDWVRGYEAFIARLRKNYPKAAICCTTSPMLGGEKDATERKFLHRIVAEETVRGDAAVRFLDFKTQSMADGLGAGWHPNVKTHSIMAEKLVATLESDLGWAASPAP